MFIPFPYKNNVFMNRSFTLFLLGFALLASTIVSCKKFEGSQTVPAYIHIDSIALECDYSVYGASTHKITDAWVYVDDQIIGCYELPTTFPVLKKGPHKVSIFAGICSNGIAASRSTYPFYKRVEYAGLNLVEDSIVNLNPVVNYYPIGDGCEVAWMEDFETANTVLPEPESDTSMVRVSGSEAWHSVNSFYSGKVELPPDSLDFTLATANEFSFYKDMGGVYCLLEMDYNCNDTFFVGVQYFKDYKLETLPLIKVTPTDKTHDKPQRWNKIYINIGHIMNNYSDASYFKVYLTSDLTTGEDLDYGYQYHPIDERRYYYFDNLKLLYRKL